MKIKRTLCGFAVVCSLVICLSSCTAIHSGYMTGSVALNAANFYYAKQNIQGKATASYFLGIGGLGKATLVDEAKQDMLINNHLLRENQALANLTVNFKRSIFLGIFMKIECIVTADVVEFRRDEPETN